MRRPSHVGDVLDRVRRGFDECDRIRADGDYRQRTVIGGEAHAVHEHLSTVERAEICGLRVTQTDDAEQLVIAEAFALGEKGGLSRERLAQVLSETAVISPSQRSKLDNVRKDEYPAAFPLRLMFKDFGLIAGTAMELSVPMPATAAAVQVAAAEHARQLAAHSDEDFSVVVRTMERLAGVA